MREAKLLQSASQDVVTKTPERIEVTERGQTIVENALHRASVEIKTKIPRRMQETCISVVGGAIK